MKLGKTEKKVLKILDSGIIYVDMKNKDMYNGKKHYELNEPEISIAVKTNSYSSLQSLARKDLVRKVKTWDRRIYYNITKEGKKEIKNVKISFKELKRKVPFLNYPS